jgi:hypothetical protein
MVRAFKLYTGSDGASHVLEGTIDEKDRTDVVAIHFKETPAHSAYDWHPDPEPQFVITLSGTLEFATLTARHSWCTRVMSFSPRTISARATNGG